MLTGLVLIILFIIISFLWDVRKSNDFMREHPLEHYISQILEIVNEGAFASEASVRVVSYKRVYLWRKHDSVLVDFEIGAGRLFVVIHYRFFGKDNTITLKYKNAFFF